MAIEQAELDRVRTEAERLERELQQASEQGLSNQLRDLSRQYAAVTATLVMVEQYDHLERQLAEARQAASDTSDPELQAMAAAESVQLTEMKGRLEEQLAEALMPSDPHDDKAALLEIRAGAGGDEAALFAGELFRMYSRYAERQKWQTSLFSSSPTGIGGLKEVIFSIQGPAAYGQMKFESGVHRVQRVPDTEKSGRVHTSTVTVAVMPVVEETEFTIDPKDLKIETSTARGHGGQSVNTTYSAIRLTHIPTGIVVSMQDERSQTQNKLRAMQIMRARVQARQEEERRQRDSEWRKNQIGTGDRSEKIRTYNFPQDRITDHRIKATIHNIPAFLDGDISALIALLRQAQRQAHRP